ncbi:translation initiation factor 2 subunit 1 [Nematocida homosporus]|uniref:translation initiation factor 2 subunit 1 n=1 Tax=Nematocida homosporus TaxID=1912981 RepID=UPI00222029B5|nr:translation initiation factor 2 subunit 1 [Nematocida homosporus]KAI5185263.1 translation initiation factor 2 subunit 1 [Nematocida homosporus]
METNQPHRYYLEQYPKEGEVVVGRIKSLTDIGAYVTLPEYNDIEGLIVYSELTKKRTRNIQKLIKVGTLEGFLVLKVDKEKGYIDLSKKRAQYEDKLSAFEKYYKGKIAHNFMQSVAVKTGRSLDKVYEEFGWEAEKEFGSLYKCFREVLSSESLLQNRLERSDFITTAFLGEVEELVKQKFSIPKIKVRADVETKCNQGSGVKVVRDILVRIEKDYPEIDVALVSSPVFSFSIMSEDGEVGEKVLLGALEKLEKRMIGAGGEYKLVMPPTTFGPRPQFDNESEESETISSDGS